MDNLSGNVLGEVQRAINIAREYGGRLDKGFLKKGALERLVQGYPTHGFVIDLPEAQKLFHNVRTATELERSVSENLPIRRQTQEPMILDLIEEHGIGNAKNVKGAQRGKRSKAKPVRGRTSASGAKQPTNVSKLRPNGDAPPAKENVDTGGAPAVEKAEQTLDGGIRRVK